MRVVAIVGMGRADRCGFLAVAGTEVRHQLRLPHRRLAAEHQLREHAARNRVLGLLGSWFDELALGLRRSRCGRNPSGTRLRRRLGVRGASRSVDLARAGCAVAASATTSFSSPTAVTESAGRDECADPSPGRRVEPSCSGRRNRDRRR